MPHAVEFSTLAKSFRNYGQPCLSRAMSEENKREIPWKTPNGEVVIRAFCTPGEIRGYSFDRQFGTHAHYKSLYTKRESLERMAGQADSNVALALAQGKDIVGFGVLAYPDADERWSEMGDLMMEVNALEVAREWRSGKIARGLIQMLLSHPQLEEKIIYFVGYSWTWDLDGNGMSAIEYRQMMIHLFEPFGFQELQTNEPNICLKPENIFMGRIGAKVTEEEQHRFKWLRFGLSP